MSGPCFVIQYLRPSSVAVTFMGKKSWLLYFNCVPDVLLLLVFLLAYLKLYQIPYNV